MTNPLDAILSELAPRWQQQGITVAPGACISALKEFEARFHVICPEDFAAYLLTVGGMPVPGEWDEHLIRFLPLAEIAPILEVLDPSLEGYFTFADYSISAHEYAIRLATPPNDVALIHNPGSRVIAPDFTNFLKLYFENPRLLF
jgi:hypothetical protein